MTTRFLGFAVLTTALVVAQSLAMDVGSATAQSKKPAVRGQEQQAALNKQWPPRTPDGQPDIQGVWGNENTGAFTNSLEPRSHLSSLGAPTLTITTTSAA